MRAFLAELGPEVMTAYVFNPALSAIELLQTINTDFGLPATTRSPKLLIDALNAHLLAERERGRRALVVIDEAQALSIDVLEQLRLLSNLETATEKLLRIVLIGQPQLRALLMHPELVQLNQRITLRWHMGPLSRRETASYLRHRLTIASGGEAQRIFTRAAVRLIHRDAGGIPRLINMVAHRAMLAAFAADRRVVRSRFVRQAYREIGSLPLPVMLPPRRTAWAAAGAGVCLAAVGAGAWALGWRPHWPAGLPELAIVAKPRSENAVAEATPAEAAQAAAAPAAAAPATAAPAAATADADAALVAAPATAAPAAAAPADAPADAAPAAAAPEAVPVASAPEPAVVEDAPPEPVAGPPVPTPEPAPVLMVAQAAPERPVAIPPDEIARRLARLDARTTLREAVAAVLAAWHVRPLAADEPVTLSDLAGPAQRRGLEDLALVGNGSMLRLLDLPAIVELRLPETEGTRWVALTGMSDGRLMLVLDGRPVAADEVLLARHWFGQAHVFWRDFDALGPTFGRSARGAPVARLQGLLHRAGVYGGVVTGEYDAETARAVLDFQRSRLLDPDGRVGRFTRIVLYAAAGGYPRPTLGAAPDGTAS